MLKGLGIHEAAHVARLKHAIDTGMREFVITAPVTSRERVAYAVAGGHRTRGIACLLACEAVGGSWHDAVSLGIAIELGHKSSVIRDDIADSESLRRGRETLHMKYGIPVALTVSDFLLSSALEQAATFVVPEYDLLRVFSSTFYAMAVGQLNDVAGTLHDLGQDADWESNHLLKTGRLAALPFEAGAVIGGGTKDQIGALTSFGTSIGVAFQLLNDVRGLFGLDGRDGDSSDLRNSRITPIVVQARKVASLEQLKEMDRLLQRPVPLTGEDASRLRAMLVGLDAHVHTEKTAMTLLTRAKHHIAGLENSLAKRILVQSCAEPAFERLVF